jgi:uncharacterized membrane protein
MFCNSVRFWPTGDKILTAVGFTGHLRDERGSVLGDSLLVTIMKTLHTPAIILTALCVGFQIFLFYSEALLPERMASHFSGGGEPNGWMSCSTDLFLFGALGAGLPLLFFILALVTRFIPAQFINLPHREYWLSPERRGETSTFITRQMLWMGCLMVLFLALTIEANRLTPVHLPMDLFLTMLGGFLVGIGVWRVVFIRHFAKAPKSTEPMPIGDGHSAS